MNEKINIVVAGNDNQVAAGSRSIVQAGIQRTSFSRCKSTIREAWAMTLVVGFLLAVIYCGIAVLI